MTKPVDRIEVPQAWLVQVVAVIDALAREGITMDGCEDPAGLMCELAVHMGVDDADDMWLAAIEAVRKPSP